MSWQVYVDTQICGAVNCKYAAIAGLFGGAIWAQKADEGVVVTEEEIKYIADTIKSDPNVFQQNGIILGGEKYICISSEPNLVRGRKNKNSLCIVATNSCLLVAVCNDVVLPGHLNNVVEKLGDYLRSNNY